MRAKAQTKGALKTSKEQVVQTKSADNKDVIVIEQANPQTVYVPSYDPAVVYGPPAYPYYPYTYPGYYPGMGLAFGTGILIGAGIANNWWGNCNWGGGDININNNNNFNRNNINNSRNNISNRQNAGGGNKFQHNPQHRGNTPYSNRKTSDKYGGNRQTNRPTDRSAANRPTDRASTNRPTDRASTNRPTDRSSANRKPVARHIAIDREKYSTASVSWPDSHETAPRLSRLAPMPSLALLAISVAVRKEPERIIKVIRISSLGFRVSLPPDPTTLYVPVRSSPQTRFTCAIPLLTSSTPRLGLNSKTLI